MLGGLQGKRSAPLSRGTVGEPCHKGRSQAKWPGLADDPAHRSPLQVALSTLWTSEGSANIHGRSPNGRKWVGEKKSDSEADEEERESLAAAANNEANRWRKTRREKLMTEDDDEKRKGKRKLYILDFRKSFQFLALSSTRGLCLSHVT